MKSLVASIVVIAIGPWAVIHGQRGRREMESPVQLLPNYHHSGAQGIDSLAGRIWKQNGPDISYDIGALAGGLARASAEQNSAVSLIRMASSGGGDIDVAIDGKKDVMIISVGHYANFIAHNVRSRTDVAEVLMMVNTTVARRKAGMHP